MLHELKREILLKRGLHYPSFISSRARTVFLVRLLAQGVGIGFLRSFFYYYWIHGLKKKQALSPSPLPVNNKNKQTSKNGLLTHWKILIYIIEFELE